MLRLKKLKESKLSKLLPEGNRQRGGVQLKHRSHLIPRREIFTVFNGSIESKKSAQAWNVINHENRQRTNSPQR
jgi:hypothetical protein